MTVSTITTVSPTPAPSTIFVDGRETQLTVRAVLPESPRSNARNLDDTKERAETWLLYGLQTGEHGRPVAIQLADLRLYTGRSRASSTVYSALWIQGEKWTTGKGSAGGYGYHKFSQAAADAIASAGVQLFGVTHNYGNAPVDFDKACDIGGVGDEAIHRALAAIGQALGYSDLQIVRC